MDDFTNSQEFIVADLVTGAIERHENSHSGNVFSPPRQRIALGLVRGEIVTRGLALAGTLLFAISVCLPWVMVVVTSADPTHSIISQVGNGPIQNFINFPLDAFWPLFLLVREHTPYLIFAHLGEDTITLLLQGAIPALGIVFAAMLWRTLDNQRTRLAVGLFGTWTVFCTIFTLFSIDRLLTRYFLFFSPAYVGIQQNDTPQIWMGFWLALVSLVALWVAVILLVREMRRTTVSNRATNVRPEQRSWSQFGGALGLTIGVPLWGVSFFLLYWATTPDCNPLPFVQTYCAGRLDAVDGLSDLYSFIYYHVSPDLNFNISTLITIFFLLVTLGGLVIMVSAWLQSHQIMRVIWLALWVALSALLTVNAVQGMLRAIANQSPDIHFVPVAEHYTPALGMYLACLAVVVNLFAVLLIWQADRRGKLVRSSPVSSEPVIWG